MGQRYTTWLPSDAAAEPANNFEIMVVFPSRAFTICKVLFVVQAISQVSYPRILPYPILERNHDDEDVNNLWQFCFNLSFKCAIGYIFHEA
jgi:hypothetical protein